MPSKRSKRSIDAALRATWLELLEVNSVSATDNFLEQGGNSMLATMLASRLEEEVGFVIDPEHIFQMTYGELLALFEE